MQLTFFLFVGAVAAKNLTKNILNPDIENFIWEVLTDWNSPGGQNVDGSWNVEKKGYGVAKADGSNITEDTLFALGSNSKASLLISNETLSPRISWKTKIASILTRMGIVASSQSTIIDLMSHRTGLPGHDLFYHKNQNRSSLISKIKYLRPSAEFREIFQYSNPSYTILSYIPEVLLKIPFARYVKEHIFDPLGLNSTTYSGDVASETGNLADGFGREGINISKNIFRSGTPRALPYWNMIGGEDGDVISGAGGVISSAKDMVLLLQGKNPLTDEQVIPMEVIQKAASGTIVVIGDT
ncbi:beta-lactamase/transpeptidase-like protein [Gymnopus androsaceus JB14]|uniref:Beta-lactamase/transpeptidase-like protein n=1 Tax=Gymnopus androsaceus JB14 TaxID=1447944 RepID=A0A6A4GKY9_9AGAR|nr:beta-lactamase/transpeptidase-like protein [Gymnopus androsaceus JB14]